ncbi:MAG TPA: DUF1080 domain-containing protein [Terracidiphilus sp.]|nr:DUF1080 domain-containing protein [Terracidiphilus sp.]
MQRRTFLKSSVLAAAGAFIGRSRAARAATPAAHKLFNGKTLKGWIQAENSEVSFSGSDILNLTALVQTIAAKQNSVASYINDQLNDATRSALSNQAEDKTTRSALTKALNKIVVSPLIYDKTRFNGVHLRPLTEKLLHRNPQGRQLAALNRMLLVDAFPADLASPSIGWIVKDGAMASTGAGRGVIYTERSYSRFRLLFTMRHLSGNPDHQACVLIFCTRPSPNEIPLDALGGIQFQIPRGGHWDYRPGRNNAGGDEFTTVSKVDLDPHQWSRVEIVADAAMGTARMAVAQPAGSTAVEVLRFHDPSAGKSGPIAWQMHNAGLFDEYKDVSIEINPENLDLITIA